MPRHALQPTILPSLHYGKTAAELRRDALGKNLENRRGDEPPSIG